MKNKLCEFNEYTLKNVNIVDVENDKIIEGQNVSIKDGIITYIGKENQKTTKEIDCEGKYLSPGLINLHVHLFGSGKPSKTVNGNGNSQEKLVSFIKTKLGNVVLNAIVKSNLKAALLSGTTTLRSVGDFLYSDVKQRDLINASKYPGPRLLCSGPAITIKGGHGDGTISLHAGSKEEFEKLVQDNISHKVDLIKIMITGGVMDAKKKGEPGELRMNKENTAWVCDYAHSLGFKVAAHVESSKGVEVALEGGVDTIEHAASLTPMMVKMFKEKGKIITTTISPAVPYAELNENLTHCTADQKYNAKIVSDGIISAAKTALKEGITIGLGTDASCPYAFHYDMWRELVYFTKYVNATNEFAVKSATLINAGIIGLDNEIGSIKDGKCADLVLLKENPYENLRNYSLPLMVVYKGKIIKNPSVKRNKYFENILDTLL